MTEEYYWRTDDPMIFRIGGEEVNLDTKGLAYAEQFGKLTAWIGTHGLTGLFSAYESGAFGDEEAGDMAMLTTAISHIVTYGAGAEALIELGVVITNKDREFVEEYFDPGWFVDALITILDNKPGIKGAFVRLWQRFFLAAGDTEGATEDQASDQDSV